MRQPKDDRKKAIAHFRSKYKRVYTLYNINMQRLKYLIFEFLKFKKQFFSSYVPFDFKRCYCIRNSIFGGLYLVKKNNNTCPSYNKNIPFNLKIYSTIDRLLKKRMLHKAQGLIKRIKMLNLRFVPSQKDRG